MVFNVVHNCENITELDADDVCKSLSNTTESVACAVLGVESDMNS